ncbi:MAG: hypothetical protein QM703_15795 [Gemmatales bacterium]
MPNDSNARQLFDKFKFSTNRIELLELLIATQQPENEWLDYKMCPTMAGGEPNFDGVKKDGERSGGVKHIWSEGVCGFANTGGGLLIWGG